MNIIMLIGGLAFFLYGMNVMSSGLENLAGGKLEQMLRKMTSNPFKSLLLGMGITIAIQSSSAMTVMLVGLVNSGIMELGQTIGVIMGSNIGTTITAWILGLAGIESDNFFVSMLKPENFSPVLALIGAVLIMTAKNDKRRSAGSILVGFAILMQGMEFMKDSVSDLADWPGFEKMITMFQNPFVGVLVGAVITAVIQSSAASVGILQALSFTGGISYGMAIPIIMGQNIGTCVTALLSSIGVNKNAKRVACVHVYFNLIGTAFFLTVFCLVDAIFKPAIIDSPIGTVGIALMHTIFNFATTFLLLPFSKYLEKLAVLTVRSTDIVKDNETTFLDERLLQTTSIAVSECKRLTKEMAEIAKDTLFDAISLIDNYNDAIAEHIEENEEKLDFYEDKLGSYLVKICLKEITDNDAKEVQQMLHLIGDFERIGDHAVNILSTAKEMHAKNIKFSNVAYDEINVLVEAIKEIITITVEAYNCGDIKLAAKVEPLEQVIDELIKRAKNSHISRLTEGQCTIEMGFVLSDLLNNFERTSDHCSNIAVCMFQSEGIPVEAHEYLENVKANDTYFSKLFKQYSEKYSITKNQ